jgi:hypothetical protein
MIEAFQGIVRGAFERLSDQVGTGLPPLLAALVILLVSLAFAMLARWLVTRIFKGIELDRWMLRSGFTAMIDPEGTIRAGRVVAQAAYWGVLLIGCLGALNVFGTELAASIVQNVVFLLPRLVGAAIILMAGLWLGPYLGRSTLVWAVNEDLPAPRKLAAGVRALVTFAAVVVAADTLNFAPTVFISAFVLTLAAAALAGGLAIGLGARDAVRRHFEQRALRGRSEELEERSLWHHL